MSGSVHFLFVFIYLFIFAVVEVLVELSTLFWVQIGMLSLDSIDPIAISASFSVSEKSIIRRTMTKFS